MNPLCGRPDIPTLKPDKTDPGSLAGEFSGHICFGERWYGFDDALYMARLLELLSQTELDVDAVFARYPTTYSTPEIKIHTTETRKFEVMDELASAAILPTVA